MRRSLNHEESPPHEDVEGQVVCWRAALHEEVGRDGPEKPTEVEATREPRILIALEVEVLLQTEDGGV